MVDNYKPSNNPAIKPYQWVCFFIFYVWMADIVTESGISSYSGDVKDVSERFRTEYQGILIRINDLVGQDSSAEELAKKREQLLKDNMIATEDNSTKNMETGSDPMLSDAVVDANLAARAKVLGKFQKPTLSGVLGAAAEGAKKTVAKSLKLMKTENVDHPELNEKYEANKGKINDAIYAMGYAGQGYSATNNVTFLKKACESGLLDFEFDYANNNFDILSGKMSPDGKAPEGSHYLTAHGSLGYLLQQRMRMEGEFVGAGSSSYRMWECQYSFFGVENLDTIQKAEKYEKTVTMKKVSENSTSSILPSDIDADKTGKSAIYFHFIPQKQSFYRSITPISEIFDKIFNAYERVPKLIFESDQAMWRVLNMSQAMLLGLVFFCLIMAGFCMRCWNGCSKPVKNRKGRNSAIDDERKELIKEELEEQGRDATDEEAERLLKKEDEKLSAARFKTRNQNSLELRKIEGKADTLDAEKEKENIDFTDLSETAFKKEQYGSLFKNEATSESNNTQCDLSPGYFCFAMFYFIIMYGIMPFFYYFGLLKFIHTRVERHAFDFWKMSQERARKIRDEGLYAGLSPEEIAKKEKKEYLVKGRFLFKVFLTCILLCCVVPYLIFGPIYYFTGKSGLETEKQACYFEFFLVNVCGWNSDFVLFAGLGPVKLFTGLAPFSRAPQMFILHIISFIFDYWYAASKTKTYVRNLDSKPEYLKYSETHLPLRAYSFKGLWAYTANPFFLASFMVGYNGLYNQLVYRRQKSHTRYDKFRYFMRLLLTFVVMEVGVQAVPGSALVFLTPSISFRGDICGDTIRMGNGIFYYWLQMKRQPEMMLTAISGAVEHKDVISNLLIQPNMFYSIPFFTEWRANDYILHYVSGWVMGGIITVVGVLWWWAGLLLTWGTPRFFLMLLDIDCMENMQGFVLAYTSMADIWRSWHASLGAFCVRYIYTPCNQAGQPLLALIFTFVFTAYFHDSGGFGCKPYWYLWFVLNVLFLFIERIVMGLVYLPHVSTLVVERTPEQEELKGKARPMTFKEYDTAFLKTSILRGFTLYHGVLIQFVPFFGSFMIAELAAMWSLDDRYDPNSQFFNYGKNALGILKMYFVPMFMFMIGCPFSNAQKRDPKSIEPGKPGSTQWREERDAKRAEAIAAGDKKKCCEGLRQRKKVAEADQMQDPVVIVEGQPISRD